ncbi:helix-turn-helix transcriptional regulator [Asticcacaulis sp.]|uniref:helix-turn-helix domain-containing protein n=1 Tax=Asticcacaulis sp. TaxID=1872648 RepID=UPI00262504F9|nr:helix-turn-helix transcriptional regulator [Asticcacaulis sp.]
MTDHPLINIKDETFVLVPLAEYEALSRYAEAVEEAAEEAWAAKVWAEHLATKARGEYIAMTKAEWARIRAGESPVRVVREHRGLTQKALSERSGVAAPEISAIEAGKRRGSVDTLKALARALGCPLDVVAGE